MFSRINLWPKRAACIVACILVVGALAQGQLGKKEAFSVASVKRFPDEGHWHIDPTRIENDRTFHYANLALRVFIWRAYGLRPFQLIGEKVNHTDERYDVNAKLPEGAGKEHIPAMLRTLLADRFHLVVHTEMRDMPAYALVVDAGGPKLKHLEPLNDSAPTTEPEPFAINRFIGSYAQTHMEGRRSIAKMIDTLAPGLMGGRVVIDRTGLTGEFDIPLDARLLSSPATDPLGLDPPVIGEWRLHDGRVLPSTAPSMFDALRKLGLRLDPTRVPVEYLIVDSYDGEPTPN